MIQLEFNLSNTEIGMINGILAVTWALSSIALTRAADITGRSKLLLMIATLGFSLATIGSGLAVGLLTLMAARAVMGLAEGGLPPLSTHIISNEFAPERRGLAVGIMSTLGLQVIPLLGPLIIVGIGSLYGWRQAFWVAGIPGLIMVVLIWFLVRDPTPQPAMDNPRGSFIPLLRLRNIRFTMVLATLNMTFYVGLLGFLPLYLVNVLGLSNAMMGTVITVQTAVMIVFAFFGPMLSDRYGRKAIITCSYLLALLGFLILANSQESQILVFTGCCLAGGSVGAGFLIMVVIPGESAPSHLKATAMGFNASVGEMLGAGAMPVVIGYIADQFGLSTLPWIMMTVAILICLITMGLRETAPRLSAHTV
jgi:MFS family permease